MFSFFKKKKNTDIETKRKEALEKRKEALKKLFPLSETSSTFIKEILNQVVGEDVDAEGNSILDFSPNLSSKMTNLWDLEFDMFGCEEQLNYREDKESKARRVWFGNHYPFVLQALVTQEQNIPQYDDRQIDAYRNHIRAESTRLRGGLIYAEFTNVKDFRVAEAIFKQPKDEGPGMDYIYRITIPNYEKNHNYILNFKIHEMAPTGVRDNILMHPITQITGLSIEKLFDEQLYWEDPYDPTFIEGNRMNMSERAEFDAFIPHHPLSIIRQHIREKILSSLKMNKSTKS